MRPRLNVCELFSIAFLGLLLATAVHAQILNGTISGTVKDPSDAVVPNAGVTVTDLATNQQYRTTSDETGAFTVANLPNGFYKVAAEHPGFAKTEIASVQVFVSQISRVAIKLEVAKTGTEVVVEANATFVQTESAELKNTIDRTQIMELPLNSRNPMDLVKSF
ncbi:MAG TPA: carboxypeptidase-like regulatory domain-containing protein, partial [Candidatus Solibacter sp.]|nr:carboxypeptidase-like regulatory domain-containing protein [Candidatus Solibacter sp.]